MHRDGFNKLDNVRGHVYVAMDTHGIHILRTRIVEILEKSNDAKAFWTVMLLLDLFIYSVSSLKNPENKRYTSVCRINHL